MTMYPVGMVEAITSVFGDADAEIAGFFFTRLTAEYQQATAIAATYTWSASTTITTGDTSEVVVGQWIRLDSDGQFFEIDAITPNVDITILNDGLVIPTGSTQSSKSITTVTVETTVDWPASGKIGIDGILYRYGSKTNTTFDDLTHVRAGRTIPGLLRPHAKQATVIDLTKDRSSLDILRGSTLVNFATEDDLDVVGRNLNVRRRSLVGNDPQYRELIKKLAYNPRGTLYGIDLALCGLLGEGNYTIFEDLVNFPNKIFITVPILSNPLEEEGKAFITGDELDPATSDTTVTVSDTPLAVGGVRWKNEDTITDCRAAKPSAQSIEEYPGDAGTTVWSFVGTNEATQVTLITVDGGSTQFNSVNSCYYEHLMRIQQESVSSMEVVGTIPLANNLDGSDPRGAAFTIHDTVKELGAGFVRINPTTVGIGLADTDTGSLLGGTTDFTQNTYHTFMIRKNDQEDVELWFDGNLVQTEPYSSFPASTDHKVEVGTLDNLASGTQFRVKQTAYYATTNTDYWTSRGSSGDVATGTPRELDVNIGGFFIGGDVGKQVTISGSTTTNAEGGNNNGRWIIESVDSGEEVTLVGPQKTGALLPGGDITTNKRIILPETELVTYPDDLGKTIVIDDSDDVGNEGSYTIGAILQQGTLTDFSTFDSTITEKSNIIEVTAGAFTADAEVDWHLEPAHVTEVGLDWELSDAGSFAAAVLTLRQALPITTGGYTRVLSVFFTDVLSAQIMPGPEVANGIIGAGPIYEVYPFYLFDPTAVVAPFLDEITAAGVIPELTLE